jgi:hypothetical protein
MEIKAGDTVSDLVETYVVKKVEDRLNSRSGRREPHVICAGLIWPVGRLTIIGGKVTTC